MFVSLYYRVREEDKKINLWSAFLEELEVR